MATRAIANLLEESERRKEEKKQEIARKRIKQVAAIIVVLVIALTCAILSASNVTAPSKPRTVSVHYTQSEFLTSDDKEIITEVRTAFIPTTSMILPPTEEAKRLVEKAQMDLISGILDVKINRSLIEDDLFNFSVELGEVETTPEPFKEYETEIESDTTEETAYERRKRESDSASLVWKSAIADNQNTTGEREVWELSETGDSDILDYDEDVPKSHSEHDEIKDDIKGDDNYKFSDIFQSFWKGEGDPESIRKTQGEVMRQYMDMNADPCEDFFQYACGNWTRHNPIPADKAGYDTFEMLRENLDIVLRDLLISTDTNIEKMYAPLQNIGSENILLRSEFIKPRVKRLGRKKILDHAELGQGKDRVNNNVDAIVKAKYLYESCMNYDIIETKGHQPLEKLLDELGGWPIIRPGWNDSHFDWVELMAKLRLYNNDILISEWVGPDMINSNEFVLHLDQTSLGLPTRDYFLQPVNQVYLDAYKYYLVKIATLLGSTSENALKNAEEIIKFETELAKITTSAEKRNMTHLYKRLTVQQLTETLPKVDWKKYLSIVLDKKLTMNEMVLIYAWNYIQDLVTLLEQTESRTISNYLLWRFVRHRVNNLDDRFQDAKQKFYFILFGREQSPPRWKNCVLQVNTNLGMALGSMFVNKYFNENSKNDTLIMAREIQRSFRELLNMTSWINNGMRSLASDKVDSMILKIGYPGFILNNDELNEHYRDVYVHPETYFENTLNILQHLTRIEQSRLGQVVNKTVWNTAPAVVNAYYSRNKNHIMFPAGILQPPLYHRYFPKSLNYGGIGVVIGHEITHGFDDRGRLFDKFGNLNSWWDELAMEAFHEKAQCIIDQYGLYTVSEVGMPLDGTNTQGENIADNGGIKQAFRAYLRWLEHNNNQDETLPGLNATNKQLFFLNFAQVWCGSTRPEAMKNKLKTAMHSPGRFRVIGTLSNSEDFAKVYNCPIGSTMNPVKKCNVW